MLSNIAHDFQNLTIEVNYFIQSPSVFSIIVGQFLFLKMLTVDVNIIVGELVVVESQTRKPLRMTLCIVHS